MIILIWIVKISNIVWAYISILVSVLVIQINSKCPFLTKWLITTIGIYRCKAFHRWINTLWFTDFKMELPTGVSLLRTAQSLLTGWTIIPNKKSSWKLIVVKNLPIEWIKALVDCNQPAMTALFEYSGALAWIGHNLKFNSDLFRVVYSENIDRKNFAAVSIGKSPSSVKEWLDEST